MKLKLKKKKSAVKKSSKVEKPGKRVAKPGEVMTGIRWSYSKEFAKALGKAGTGKGRARRNDVKVWGASVLDKAAAAMTGEAVDE
jgi:hypothetical protein